MDLTLTVAFTSIGLMLALILGVGVLASLDRPRPPSDLTGGDA